MLSETYTIIDIKDKLQNIYSFYGYDSDEEFDSVLESVSEDVMRLYLYPKIGNTEYARIQALDKVDLTATEEYLYWGEVYAVCYEFLKSRTNTSGQLQSSANESLTVEGYSYKTSQSSGSSPNDESLRGFYDKMFSYFKLAGFNMMSLERTCTIFGDSESYDNVLNIIE